MKKIFLTLTAIIFLATSEIAFAADSPTCAFLKFTNDTRYQNIGVAENFSELVLEKLLAKTPINIIETQILDENLEELLYNEKIFNIASAKKAVAAGNLNLIFEGDIFNPARADSISTAELGQILSPELTKKIGEEVGAEYLIHGTIANLGNGTWDESEAAFAASLITSALFGGPVNTQAVSSGIFLQCDLRIIKAETGEVVWKKSFAGQVSKTATGTGRKYLGMGISVDSPVTAPKLESKAYSTLLEKTVDEITKGVIEDFNAGKLFAK